MLNSLQQLWQSNARNDLLAGVVVALALIPEAIAFSIIAGVAPKVGLYASFCIATVTAFAGGRPGMISAVTGAMALLMVTLARFVSRSVITGFVNALVILIFLAQIPELANVTWHVYAMTAAGLSIIYLFPRLTRAIPSPLVAIVLLTAVVMVTGMDIRTVGDMGTLPDTLPVFLLPDVPLNLETLMIILPVSATLAVVRASGWHAFRPCCCASYSGQRWIPRDRSRTWTFRALDFTQNL